MRNDPAKLLYDVSEATRRLVRFAKGKSFEDYKSDELLRSGVERQFEIVGEALNRLNREHTEIAGKIPELRAIISLRNILAHGYDRIDDAVVWGILEHKVPALQMEMTNY